MFQMIETDTRNLKHETRNTTLVGEVQGEEQVADT